MYVLDVFFVVAETVREVVAVRAATVDGARAFGGAATAAGAARVPDVVLDAATAEGARRRDVDVA